MSEGERILEIIKSEEKHRRYNFAVQNKIRRTILSLLAEGEKSFLEIQEYTKLGKRELEYQLSVLKYGECLEENTSKCYNYKIYKITPEGKNP